MGHERIKTEIKGTGGGRWNTREKAKSSSKKRWTEVTALPGVRLILPGVTIARSGRWWIIELPSFQGAYSQGKSKTEAYRNLLDALRELVESYIQALPPRIRATASETAARKRFLKEVGARKLAPGELQRLLKEHNGP